MSIILRKLCRAPVLGAATISVLIWPGAVQATPVILTLTATDAVTHATQTTRYSDAATPLCPTCIVSGSPNDLLVNSGSLLGGRLTFSGQQALALLGASNTLASSALSVSNTGPHTIDVSAALVGFNFSGPSDTVEVTGGGTWLNTRRTVMSLGYYDDPTNSGLDTPAQLVASFVSSPAVAGVSSYVFNPTGLTSNLVEPDAGLYSMTVTWSYALASGGALLSRVQTETKTFAAEPPSLMLLGAGLLGLGVMMRRRRAARDPGGVWQGHRRSWLAILRAPR